ncbi:MAG: hypothetical protein NVSMB20_08150 [Bradyrhizobium sp.]
MVLSMARPYKPSNSSFYWLRKGVPAPLREIVGKRELKETLGTSDPEEAKAKAREVGDRFDAILASAKAQAAGKLSTLSLRDIEAIVGRAYNAEAAKYENDPGEPAMWDERESYYCDLWVPDEEEHLNGPRSFQADKDILEAAMALLGVTCRIVQNCTLSRQGREHRSNISQGPKRGSRIGHAPDIIAG